MKLTITSLSIAFTLLSATVYAQSTTQNECNYPNVCYTVNQDKRCLEMFEINIGLNSLVDQTQELLEASFYENEKLKEDNEKKEVKIKKKNTTIIKLIASNILAIAIIIIR